MIEVDIGFGSYGSLLLWEYAGRRSKGSVAYRGCWYSVAFKEMNA